MVVYPVIVEAQYVPSCRATQIKTLCWLLMSACISVSILIGAVKTTFTVLTAPALPTPAWLLLRLAVLAHSVFLNSVCLHVIPSTWSRRFSQAVQVDWTLMVLLNIPLSILLSRLATPDMQHPSWTGHFSVLLVIGAILDLPTTHSLLQLLVIIPFLVVLELYDTCNISNIAAPPSACMQHTWDGPQPDDLPSPLDSSSHQTSCSTTTHSTVTVLQLLHQCSADGQLSNYLLTRLPVSIACMAAAVVIPFVIFTAHRSKVKGAEAAEGAKAPSADEQRAAAAAPLESLGLHVVSRLGLRGVLEAAVHCLGALIGLVSERLIVRLICIPLGTYYLILSVLSRHMAWFQREIGMDEFIAVMMVFFMLGRESCKLDVMPFLAQSQSHLRAATAVLSDLLPKHIVKRLIHQEGAAEQQAAADEAAGFTADVDDMHVHADSSPMHAERSRSCSPAFDLPGGFGPGGPSSSSSGGVEEQRLARLAQQLDARPVCRVPSASSLASLRSAGASLLKVLTSRGPTGARSRNNSFSSPPQRSQSYSAQRNPFEPGSFLPAPSRSPVSTVSDLFNEGGAMNQGRSLKLAEAHDCLTIFFSDVCGFSNWAHKLSPDKVMTTLNDLYTRMDDIIINEMPNLYKVETIGDAYVSKMVAGNLLSPDPEHAANMVRFALRAQQEAAKVPRPDLEDGTALQLRIGVHSGPAMSGIVGKLRRRFCIFGDTVNMASRTETCCPQGCVQVTASTHRLAQPRLDSSEVVFQDRGDVELKGAEHPVRMYLVYLAAPG